MRRSVPLALMLCVTTATATDTMKPGLWEMTMKSDEMARAQVPPMSPEQREQMRNMGIELPEMRDGAVVQRVCITREMTQRTEPPGAAPPDPGCKMRNHERRANSFRADVVCDGPNLKGTGVMKGNYAGPERFSSSYQFSGTSRGKPVTQQHETSFRWLGADCGKVMPMGQMYRMPRQ